MKQSQLFTKTERFAPKDEETINAQLLTRAGFIEKLMAGVYNYLPLGLLTLRKIERVVREEMNQIGGQEILLAMLHPKENWQTTGGWDKIDVLFKIKSRTEKEYALGQSEEEVITPLVMRRARSEKDLPLAVYQIHWKFRDELRAKSGLLRGREFLMKDMYSFHADQADFDKFYEVAKIAYLKIFARLGLTAKVTEASGGSFSNKISYEFMVLADAGEDDILYCDQCVYCVNQVIAPSTSSGRAKENKTCPKCQTGKLSRAKASEVGNVFDLGQKYGQDFNLGFTAKDGTKKYPIMGCYGIGISRLMGVLVEKYHDDKGIIWPQAIAPFQAHLLSLDQNQAAEKIYQNLTKNNIEVLYDDREMSAGGKFADADLIGLPYRLVVSEKSLLAGGVEMKKRNESQSQIIKEKEILKMLQ